MNFFMKVFPVLAGIGLMATAITIIYQNGFKEPISIIGILLIMISLPVGYTGILFIYWAIKDWGTE